MGKNTKRNLLIGGAASLTLGGLLWWAFRKKSAIESLEVDVKDLKVSFKSTALQAGFNLLVNNPSKEVLKFLNFTGSMYADGQPLGTIDISKAVTIPAKGKATIPVATVLPLNNIVNTFLNLLTTKKLPTAGILKGTVTLSGGISIPIYYQFPFTSPTTI